MHTNRMHANANRTCTDMHGLLDKRFVLINYRTLLSIFSLWIRVCIVYKLASVSFLKYCIEIALKRCWCIDLVLIQINMDIWPRKSTHMNPYTTGNTHYGVVENLKLLYGYIMHVAPIIKYIGILKRTLHNLSKVLKKCFHNTLFRSQCIRT